MPLSDRDVADLAEAIRHANPTTEPPLTVTRPIADALLWWAICDPAISDAIVDLLATALRLNADTAPGQTA